VGKTGRAAGLPGFHKKPLPTFVCESPQVGEDVGHPPQHGLGHVRTERTEESKF